MESINDLLNQIIWMHSISDILDAFVAIGPGVVIGMVVLGVIQCFFGYKLFRYEMAALGASVLGVGTYVILRFLLHYTGNKLIFWTAFAAFMGAGMMFTVSAILVFLTTVVAMGAFLFFYGTKQGWTLMPNTMIIIAVFVGIIAMILYKHVLMISQSLMGATLIGLFITHVFESEFMGLVLGIVFAVLGLITQYWMYILWRKKEKRKDKEAEEAYAKKQAQKLAKKSKIVDNHIDGVAEANPQLDYSKMYPSQTDLAAKTSSGVPQKQANTISDSGLASAQQSRTASGRPAPRLKTAPMVTANPQPATPRMSGKTDMLRGAQSDMVGKSVNDALETATAKEKSPLDPTISETGTISVGDLKSKMKRVSTINDFSKKNPYESN